MSQEQSKAEIEAHEGRAVGVKVLVDFDPDEATRLTQLANEAGLPLTDYLKRLVADAATTRTS